MKPDNTHSRRSISLCIPKTSNYILLLMDLIDTSDEIGFFQYTVGFRVPWNSRTGSFLSYNTNKTNKNIFNVRRDRILTDLSLNSYKTLISEATAL